MARNSIARRLETQPEPNLSTGETAGERLTLAAAYIRDAMSEMLIFAAALKGSDCEVARAVGKRLEPENLYNDLDVAREIVEDVARSTSGGAS